MRVVIADDAVLVRRGIAALLTDAGVDVVGQAGDAGELLAVVRETIPDVAVIDIRMPPTHSDEGIRAADGLRREFPGMGMLLLSQYVDVDFAVRILDQREAHTGYLLKERVATVAELIDALDRVHHGGTVVDPTLVASLLDRQGTPQPLSFLTARERQVLALLAEGRTDRAIAEHMNLSRKTIEIHIRAIFRKLELPTTPLLNKRVHAVLWFLRG